jgi:hypothetical protein
VDIANLTSGHVINQCRRVISEETVYGECVLNYYKEDCMTRSRDKELAKHTLDLKLRHPNLLKPATNPMNEDGVVVKHAPKSHTQKIFMPSNFSIPNPSK